MKRTLFTLLSLLIAWPSLAVNYYLDSRKGNDKASGRAPHKAWRSLERLEAIRFEAGDSILLRRGSIWQTTEPLRLAGSGREGIPIVLSAYGEGHRPILAGNGFTGSGVVALCNQSWWTISELELTNWADEAGDRRGVEIHGENGGLLQGIHIVDMEIHHIKGIAGNGSKEKRTAGVEFLVRDDSSCPTRFDDISVERCHIHHIDNQGIVLNNKPFEQKHSPGDATWADRMFTRLVVRDNVIHDISKNAMIIRMADEGVVEHNICFLTARISHGGNTIFSRNVRGTLFQYNEGFLNISPYHDGSFYDADINSPSTTWRYSYSHDNAHGLFWLCTGARDVDIKVYDNVSENDRGYLVYPCYDFTEVDVYRNLFYVAPYTYPYFFRIAHNRDQLHFTLTDNILINESDSLTYQYPHEAKSRSQCSHHLVARNQFLGKPLRGDYRSEEVDPAPFKPFHRGFLYATPLDKLVGNRFVRFEAQQPEADVVGTIADQPVYRFELEREIARHRWLGAGCSPKEAERVAYERAVATLTLIKVQLAEMAARGMEEAAVATDLERLRAMENAFRRTTNREEVMWFGPRELKEGYFWDLFFARAQEELRKRMALEPDFQFSEQQLHDYWQAATDRADTWHKRGYLHSRKAVRAILVGQRYDALFAERAKAAEVKL